MIAGILKFLFICAEVVLIFNLLILVHELGHFLAARWRGLVVDKFAIWFGKPIWKKTIGGVEYRLGSIPAGGFVSIPQLAPMEVMEGKSDLDRTQLPPATALDKIIVALAGPVFSLGLAFVFAVIVWAIGRPVSEAETTTTIGYVLPDGPAAKAGLAAGDKILEINGNPVTRFGGMGKVGESITWNIARSESPVIPIKVNRNGETLNFEVEAVSPPRSDWGRKNLRQISILPRLTPIVARVYPHSPAEEAGLKPRDQIVAANGQQLLFAGSLVDILKASGTNPVTLTIKRGDSIFDVSVTPRIPKNDTEPRIGIVWDDRGVVALAHPNPFQQIAASVNTMWETITAVLSPKSEIKAQHLSGPVGIMRIYYLIFESPDGWRLALYFSVVLNVNLALLNLLPIPVLDGGHITLAIIEGLTRRPINVRVLEWVQAGFAMLIIGMMIYITFYDVLDLPRPGAERAAPKEISFTPEPSPAASP